MDPLYAAIDLKSFYASCECVERGLDPLKTNLVVADAQRTEKTICLAVTPPLKARGVPSRPRLFEVISKVREINRHRYFAFGAPLRGASDNDDRLNSDPSLAVDYIVAPPQMAKYIAMSRRIYGVYLKYVAPEDIFVYSIDEVFIDIAPYLKTYKTTAEGILRRMVLDVYRETGITATCGIGTNLYLAKVCMDIVAKRMPPDKNGARVATLDEEGYRRLLWDHRPITDFWRVGRGYAAKLSSRGMYTMGDVALRSLTDEETLYRLFGVNAELLIDHAWGRESCTMADIKAYTPSAKSASVGQVLSCPYKADTARIVVREMCEQLVLDLVARGVATRSLTLTVGYDRESLSGGAEYTGNVSVDHYGRLVPYHSHGTVSLPRYSSSTFEITGGVTDLFDKIVNKALLIRRLNVTACDIRPESFRYQNGAEQMSMFVDYSTRDKQDAAEAKRYAREKCGQRAMLLIKSRFGKNSIFRAMDLLEGATTLENNERIGGHRA